MSDLYYDPYDYDIDADPHPVWKRMRDEAPLYRNEKFDFFALSRFRDVMAGSIDAETYSSGYGTVLELMVAERGIPLQPMCLHPRFPRRIVTVSKVLDARDALPLLVAIVPLPHHEVARHDQEIRLLRVDRFQDKGQ